MPTIIEIARAYILRGEAYSALQEHFTEGGFKNYTDGQKCMNRIKAIPAADVVEVRHAHWCVTDAYPHHVYCSACFITFAQEHWEVWKDGSLPRDYCPNCGAKMDGGQDEAPSGPYDLLYEEGGPDA